jgi:hypothetical protein
MRLYSGMSEDFIRDTARNQIADRLREAFFTYYRHAPSPGEVNSWRNSLRALKDVVDEAGLTDHGVLLEYQLPLSSKRIDCLFCGRDRSANDRAVIVELKQWEACSTTDADNLVQTWVGNSLRDVLHPAVQVDRYRQYLADTHTAFHEGPTPIDLSSCAYLHNYHLAPDDPLREPKFHEVLSTSPVFDADGWSSLGSFLVERLALGAGAPVLQRIERSRYRPSRKLMDHVADTIRSKSPWILLDEQLVVYERIRAAARRAFEDRRKQVIIVRGGPGTGKSVIAINLMADLLREGRNTHYVTGSRAFTETLRSIIGTRSPAVFKYFNSYAQADHNGVDVLVCDESHRIRATSISRFTPKAKRSGQPQAHELIEASKVTVFFVDDRQTVRPNEIGSADYLTEQARALGATVSDYTLEVQYRCAGSDRFVQWIDNTLGIRRTADIIWDGADGFDFRILGSPDELEGAIRARADDGVTARMVAGFCWPWSDPGPDGTLVYDVVIGNFRRPWNAKPNSRRLARGIPPASLWANDPAGIDQVGCVYTAQGFEMDYVGLIWGTDLRYIPDEARWQGNPSASHDTVVKRSGDRFLDLVKNTYRVLLSRGMKGCYVCFLDKETERFVRSRMEGALGG